MTPLFRILKSIVDGGLTDASEVARRLSLQGEPDGKTRLEVYKKSLKRVGLVVIVLPLVMLVVGLVGDMGWLVASIGIFWSLVTIILLGLAAPIGIILEVILGGNIRGSGTRYYKLCLGLLLAELTFTLFRSVVPISNNPKAVPIVTVCAAILGILGAMGANTPSIKKIIGFCATVTLFVFMVSFFFPETFRAASQVSKSIDKGVASIISGEDRGRSQVVATSSIDTLGCSTGKYIQPNPAGTTRYVVMPNDCWTNIICRPKNGWQLSKAFWVDARGEVWMQFCFDDQSWEKPHIASPIGIKRYNRVVTGVRFKNAGNQPIVVDLRVS